MDSLAGATWGAAQPLRWDGTHLVLSGAQLGCLWRSMYFPGTGAGSWQTPG